LGSIIEKRRRMEQAIAASRALISQYESTEEAGLRQLVARARILEAAALVLSGHVGPGFRAFDVLTKSGDEAVAEVFSAFATDFKSEGGFYGEFGSVSSLFHRAATLGQGDPRMTRIAYEESISLRHARIAQHTNGRHHRATANAGHTTLARRALVRRASPLGCSID
jgi:hypothetical protein